jgi:hypothetical protein
MDAATGKPMSLNGTSWPELRDQLSVNLDNATTVVAGFAR